MDGKPFPDPIVKQNSELQRTEYDEEKGVYRLVYQVSKDLDLDESDFDRTESLFIPDSNQIFVEFSDGNQAVKYHFQEFGETKTWNDPDTREIDLLIGSLHDIARRRMANDSEEFFSHSVGGLEDRETNERYDLIELANCTNPENAEIMDAVLEDVMERYAERLSKEVIARNYSPEDSGIEISGESGREYHDFSLDPFDVPDVEDKWIE
ncbi:MAG: hypothetical protein ABEJ56_00955 [Candidatus Nanohaloarchaea archaeon]